MTETNGVRGRCAVRERRVVLSEFFLQGEE